MNNKFVVIDIETTGNSPKKGDRIIQIGVVLVENGTIVDKFSSFLNPEKEIPLFIQQFTGITNEMIVNAPSFSEIAPVLMGFLNESYFVAHNVPFDLSFVQNELEMCGYDSFKGPILDTVELARLLLPTEESYKLNHLSTQLGFSHDRPHQADSDSEVTAEILIYLIDKLSRLPLLTLQRLKPIIKSLDSALDVIIDTFINNKLKTTTIFENEADLEQFRQLVIRKPTIIKEDIDHINVNNFDNELQMIEGKLATSMTNFEIREGQKEMMAVIDKGLNENQHVLIEAGTGTGKSLSYLLPSLYFAKRTDTPVLVSTHTVQLQEQLIDRDINILKQVVPFSFNTSVLKGRSHYLCLRKFEQKLNENFDMNYDTALSKAQILVWLTETENGDVEHLNLPSGGNTFWLEVQSDATTCVGKHCPWFSRCFYHRARNKSYKADLIITNHALLFTDMIQDHQLIPNYKQVIIDEAHHLEDVASNHFGTKTDYIAFSQLFSKLGTLHTNDLIHSLFNLQQQYTLNLDDDFEKIDELIIDLKYEIDDCFTQIHDFVYKRVAPSKNEIGRKSLRYYPNKMDAKGWKEIQEVVNRVQMHLKDTLKLFKKILDEFTLIEEKLSFIDAGTVSRFTGYYSQLLEEKNKLEELLLMYDPNFVYWVEVDIKGAKNATFIYSKPIEISDLLAENFFSKKRSVIMTSATLSVKNSFDYIIQRLGLEDFGVVTKMIDSPFRYKNQVQLMIPANFPNIKDVDEAEYIYEVAISVLDIAKITDGRMLVLFTSMDMLRKTFYQLKDFIENEEFVLIGQGISGSSRAKLTKSFKQFEKAILFGTSSFWEGVDIPGDDLSCLVIVRLPFSPPDNPIFEAKSELTKQQGKSPFMDLSLPQAIIRFKQGFGRLIRSSTDRGVVFVFDRRITSTRYGKVFIKSLPEITVKEDNLQNLLYDLKNWL